MSTDELLNKLEERLSQSIDSPKSVSVDGMSVNEWSPQEIVDAIRQVKELVAHKNKKLGIRLFQIIAGGSG